MSDPRNNLLVTVVYESTEYGKDTELCEDHECADWGYNPVMTSYELRKINDDGEVVTVGYVVDRVIKYTVISPLEEEGNGAGSEERPV